MSGSKFNWKIVGGLVVACMGLGYCVNHAGDQMAQHIKGSQAANAKADADIAAIQKETGGNSASSADAASDQPSASDSKWTYSQDKDEMRGSVAKFAELVSNNTVDLPFPYGNGINGKIVVRHRSTDGLHVMFQVDKGQILCSKFEASHVAVKFDGAPVTNFECSSSNDGSSDVAFIEASSRFVTRLKRSKHVTIEADMYDAGPRQWNFDTAGLNWSN